MATPPLLQFRDFAAHDLPTVARAMGDPEVTRFYGLETTQTAPLAIAREQVAWYHAQCKAREGWWQAICVDGLVVGGLGVYDRDDDGDSAELGYWLLPSHWGQGVMRRALPQWLPKAFQQLDLHSIVAYVEPENRASTKLLSAAGFVHEGLMRECTKRDDSYVSLERYSLLRSELQHPN